MTAEHTAVGQSIDRATVLDRYEKHVNRGLARLSRLAGLPLEVSSAGCYVYSEDGRAFLDCGGYSVFLLGHRHPRVVAAVRSQLDLNPLATRVLINPLLARAAEALAAVTPAGLDYVCFTNSGAEAVEVALKLARISGKTRLIAMEGGFHGKTLGALSVTGREHYREPFEPLLPGVTFIPFGDAGRLAEALERDGADACVILEPVQAENGVVIPPPGYLRNVRELCDRFGSLCILDEIQVGLGRVGTWWGADAEGVAPDVLLAGKALSGGVMPIGAAITTAAVYERLNRDPLLHSSTFAGNPLATAAAAATIEVIKDEGIVDRARALGSQAMDLLRAELSVYTPRIITEVRGVGLLIGIQFAETAWATDFVLEMLHRGVILSTSLNASRVVRVTPPAILTEADVRLLIDAARSSASALAQRYISRS